MTIDQITIAQAREIMSLFSSQDSAITDPYVFGAPSPTTAAPSIGSELIGQYVIVRTHSAGVHAGVLTARAGREVLLTNSRRIWYWEGAATLSELALRGTKKPDTCKFPAPLDKILLTEVIEILPCTDEARISIQKVAEWKA